MKLTLAGLFVALASATFVGCSQSPSSAERHHAPMIEASATRKVQDVGETTRVTASTMNLIGSTNIRWSVSPTTGKIQPDGNDANLSAIFSANQPGVYIVTAWAEAPDGTKVRSNDVTITVNGRPQKD